VLTRRPARHAGEPAATVRHRMVRRKNWRGKHAALGVNKEKRKFGDEFVSETSQFVSSVSETSVRTLPFPRLRLPFPRLQFDHYRYKVHTMVFNELNL
jgi:hypothetical protein